MIRAAGRFTWDVLALAGASRAGLALLATAAHPDVLRHVNAAGIPVWAQFTASMALLSVGLVIWRPHPIRRAWATVWLVGAGEFGSSSLVLAEWRIPSMLPVLLVLVPAATAVSLVGFRRSVRDRHFLPWALSADATLLAASLIVLARLTTASAALQLGFWGSLLAATAASALAFQRRRPHVAI